MLCIGGVIVADFIEVLILHIKVEPNTVRVPAVAPTKKRVIV